MVVASPGGLAPIVATLRELERSVSLDADLAAWKEGLPYTKAHPEKRNERPLGDSQRPLYLPLFIHKYPLYP